ncbi:HAD family hydrolase [Xylanimonas oleitrophica]|uniref:Cof-type HAD-IIB family hydrolase n=1 Tax=Xylanimonas oleitrophica TaxID=2607479 RepID=UPI002684EC9F
MTQHSPAGTGTPALTDADLTPLPDVRLVVTDMDGTLLDSAKNVPAGFWPLLDLMRERGIVLVPASGRQYATLAREFSGALEGMPIIAENGSYVARDGVELSSVTIPGGVRRGSVAYDVVQAVRQVAAGGRDVGTVVCGKRSAYVERTDAPFREQASMYYAALEEVEDLTAVEDEILKVAVFDFEDVEVAVAPALQPFGRDSAERPAQQVVISGRHWVDVMSAGVTKGDAVQRLQEELGVTREQTVAFGDYLNDVEMLDAAGWSFAVEGAHPQVLERARFRAPSNDDHGVVRVLERLLGVGHD